MGIDYETFKHMTPNDLNNIYPAWHERERKKDEERWWIGKYVENAVLSALAQGFDKNCKKSIYPQKPYLAEYFENIDLTEEEIQERAILKAIEQEQLWQANHNIR